MRQLAQYQDGRLEIQEVPEPVAPPGGILVRVTHSVISPGTERMKVEQARMNLLQKARSRPDQVRQVLRTAKTLGWRAAAEKVRNRLESPTPLGYSAAGVVIAVDELNSRFQAGDRVACGGAECAHHAEVISVPDMLAALVPESVSLPHAAHTTLSSIAMHAMRQSGVAIGEKAMVIGQGLIGQLVTAVLSAAGVRAMGVDLADQRLAVATQMGAERTANPKAQSAPDVMREWTGGLGVDAVFLCIGGNDKESIALAIECLRDRGVLVIVGMMNVALDWKSAFTKEIEVRYARSYGPGRYDSAYEWGGNDYPAGYVRWTENRNFEACLHLMAAGKLPLGKLITKTTPFEEAVTAYESLMNADGDLSVVLEYPDAKEESSRNAGTAFRPNQSSASNNELHVIGAGNFARTMLLPHLKDKIALGTVVNGTGLSARHVKEKFSFKHATTDAGEALNESGAVLIATRHHLHAPLVKRALEQGRHVFVEKPLCLSRDELSELDEVMKTTGGSVMVGFNRRFAPATREIRDLLRGVPGPKSLAYHVFAGPMPADHWYADIAQSGGRVISECCHFFDHMGFLVGAKPVQIFAQTTWPVSGSSSQPDSISAQVSYSDGSSAQLIYSAEGDFSFPKETLRVFAAGLVLECENFQRLDIHQGGKSRTRKFASKGHAEEMTAWLEFIAARQQHPLPYEEARLSTLLTFAALDSIREGKAVRIP